MESRFWKLRTAPGGDVDTASPKTGFPRFFYLLRTHFWKFAELNLIFLVCSIPVITIPAALCGVNRVCLKLIREGNVFLWEEFRGEFRASFVRSLAPGALFGALLFAGYYCMSLGLTNAALPLWSLLFWVLGIAAGVLGLGWGAYCFVLMPLLSQGNRALMKNALLLCLLQPGRALAVCAVAALAAAAAAVFFPVSTVLLLFGWGALAQYGVCFLVNGPAERYIIGPYEAKEGERGDD